MIPRKKVLYSREDIEDAVRLFSLSKTTLQSLQILEVIVVLILDSYPNLSYQYIVFRALEIINVCNSLACFFICFFALLWHHISAERLLWIELLVLLLSHLLFMVIKFPRAQWISFILSSFKSSLIQSFTITFLSPILKTLTESYADDTICLLVTICCLAHLIAFDYGFVHEEGTSPSSLHNKTPVSINAIFFASVIMVSRIQQNSGVVSMILLSWSIFGLFPELRRLFRQSSLRIYSSLPLISSVVILALLFKMFPAIVGIIYIVILGIITVLGPILFIYFYQFKNDIMGPWDLAQVKRHDHLD